MLLFRLKKKLVSLESELNDVKLRCNRLKAENEWYRDEIETSKKDTVENLDLILFI